MCDLCNDLKENREAQNVRPDFYMVLRELGPGENDPQPKFKIAIRPDVYQLRPSVKHDTEISARKEAERLAALHPLSKFHVLAHIGTCHANRIVWEEVKE